MGQSRAVLLAVSDFLSLSHGINPNDESIVFIFVLKKENLVSF